MKITLRYYLTVVIVLFTIPLVGQEFTAGINTETPNPNAVLHLVAPNGNQGLLIPSLTTTQRNAMATSLTATDNGLMVFDSDVSAFFFWVNPNWIATTNTDNQNLTLSGTDLTIDNGNTIDLSGINTDNQNLNLAGSNLSIVGGNTVDLTTAGFLVGETDPTVLASVKDGVDWTELTGIPADISDGDDGIITEADPTVLASVKDGVDWTELTGIPADISDGDDGIVTELDPTVPANIKDGIDWTEVTSRPAGLDDGDDVGILTETDPTVLASVKDGVDWTELTGIPADISDGDDGIITETDPTVLASVKDGVDWTELTGIPADISDGDDGIVTELDPTVPANIKDGIDWTEVTSRPAGLDDGDDVGILTETDPTVLASVKDGVDWTELTGIPADISDGDDGIITEADPTVLASVKDGVDWTELTGIPADISDGDDGIVTELDPTVPANIKDGIDWTEVTSRPAGLDDGDDVGILTETDPTVLASVKDGVDWTELTGIPADISDGDDGIITEADPTVLASVKDGVDWTELTGIPADISDGDDGIITEADPTVLASVKDGVDWTELTGIPADISDGDDGIVTELDPTVPANIKDGIDWTEVTSRPAGLDDGDDVGILTETDPTVLASVKDGVDWTELTGIPADISDGDDGIVTELDPTVLASVKDGVDWTELTGIPADISDGDDGIVTELDPTVLASVKDGVDWTELTGIPADISDGDDGIITVASDGTLNGDGDGVPLSVNVGIGVNQIVQLDGSSRLPNVDGSQLINVNQNTSLSNNAPVDGEVLTWNNTNSWWEASPLASPLNSGSGVTINTTNIDLGGTLTSAATVTTAAGSLDFIVNGAGVFDVDAIADFSANASFSSIDVTGGAIAGASLTQQDNTLIIEDDGDGSKRATFELSGIGTGTTRQFILPDQDGTVALLSDIGSGDYSIDGNENNLGGNTLAAPTGNNNIVLGFNSGPGISTGSDNIIIGTGADNTAGTTGGNIGIGNTADASGSDAIAIGTNTLADAPNAVAIGTNTEANVPNTIVLGDGINSDFFVGIGVQDVRAPLQIGGELSFGHFENATEGIDGDAILSNAYPDYASPTDNLLRRSNTDSVSFIFFDDGEILFLNAPNGAANSALDLSNSGDVSSWLEMRNDGNIEVRGGLTLGDVDPGEERDGMIRYNGGAFEGYNSGAWNPLGGGGLTLPYNPGPIGNAADLFFIEQTGAGSAGRFEVSNGTSSVTALSVETDGAAGSRGMHVVATGAGDAAEFTITGGGNGAAVQGNTTGTGVAGSFAITNVSNASNTLVATTNGVGGALSATITNGSSTGSAIFASTSGTGSVLNANHSGTAGSAIRVDMNNSSSNAAIEVINSNGPSIITDGDVGIGFASARGPLDVNVGISTSYITGNSNVTTGVLQVENAGSGDASIRFDVPGFNTVLGIDQSEGSAFKINMGTLLTDGTADFAISPSGNVGIGTATPGAPLDVVGNADISGNVSIGAGNIVLNSTGGISASGQINANAANITTAEYRISGTTVINGSRDVTGNNVTVQGNLISAVTGPVNDGFTPASRIVRVAGGANINTINGGVDGMEIILITAGSCDFGEAGNIDLTTGGFSPLGPNSTLHLVHVGGTWVEISRTSK